MVSLEFLESAKYDDHWLIIPRAISYSQSIWVQLAMVLTPNHPETRNDLENTWLPRCWTPLRGWKMMGRFLMVWTTPGIQASAAGRCFTWEAPISLQPWKSVWQPRPQPRHLCDRSDVPCFGLLCVCENISWSSSHRPPVSREGPSQNKIIGWSCP